MAKKVILTPSVTIVSIPTGAGGIVRGRTITVKGTAGCTKETFDTTHPENDTSVSSPGSITQVAVRFGLSGAFVKAHPTGPGGTWSKWVTDARTISGVVNDTLQITARVSAGAGVQKAQDSQAVTVIVDRTPPVLDLITPAEMTQAVVDGKTTFEVTGTANDERSPFVVEWMLGGLGQQFTLATPRAAGDWSSWTAAIQVSPAGKYTLLVRARDSEENITQSPVTLNAVETFQPKDPGEVFNLAAYLDDLLKFAGRRMVDEQNTALTSERLSTTYNHPFGDLTDPNNREAATAPVHQQRVCVEVLRAFLSSINRTVPPEQEATYLQGAYRALLRNLGTSFDEIRRARGDEAARVRLASRLGIDRPDHLDQLALLSGDLTESALELLFGLQDTTRDPLARGPQPLLLTWRLARLRAQWLAQDDAGRTADGRPVPIIDPDILARTDFRTPNQEADPAFALWDARTVEMSALLTQIDDLRKSKSTALDGFDAVVSQFVAGIEELTAMLADYRAAKDITARLAEKNLSMAAFLYLMRSRDLAVAGTVLNDDWAGVYAIAAQVSKLGLYAAWREQEQEIGLILGPDLFVLPDLAAPLINLPEWRATFQARQAWQATLQTRINQQQDVIQAQRTVVDATEKEVLPVLRDLLVALAGDGAPGLLIDLAGGAAQQTTRLEQAVETLQGALFAVRVGAVTVGPAIGWKLASNYSEADFDEDWTYWGAYETWQGAMRVFIFPESHLLPTLRPVKELTEAFQKVFQDPVNGLRSIAPVTPDQARDAAEKYLTQLQSEFANDSKFPPVLKNTNFEITERQRDDQLAQRQALCADIMRALPDPLQAPNFLEEVFYFVPLFCAFQLQRSGEYLAALDWYQSVYAYHLPLDQRPIYFGLTLEEQIPTQFVRPADWPREGLNPHDIAKNRAFALTRFIVISLVRCFEQFADTEFTRDTNESVARARNLYQTALDQLESVFPTRDASSTIPSNPFGLDPVVEALRLHAQSNLRKLRLGRNIAGLDRQPLGLAVETAIAPRQPTPYRYVALIQRAKELIQNASQMEAALLSALEKRDAESYNLLKAVQDLELADATVDLHELLLAQALDGIKLAMLQRSRAQIQCDHFQKLLDEGTSTWETLGLAASGIGMGLASDGGSLFSGLGSFFGQAASLERREEDWELQRDLASQDEKIGQQQVTLAIDQVSVATQESRIAHIQKDHAGATVQFLAGKFTSAELYEFMSGVLDGIYRFFLQQATAMAKLAENQLAFERQEAPQGIIQGDYYSSPEGGPDTRGITGSARLLADIVQLDQHAFLTDQRKLQLTKTLSLARFAPIEFARFRETGVLVFGTPQELFDRDFPGHYLRLIKRVRTSVLALVPPIDGIHATLGSVGTSRVVIAGDTFRNVVVRRNPESVSFSSPRDATGLFELVPDSQPELLLPFEGSGVDAVWRFELPKAANLFDFSTIADVLLTIEYTALSSFDYRQQVIRTLRTELSLDRPFSFRQEFADQWYELNNPDQATTPMTVRFKTTRGDFLSNLDELTIRNLVLYLATANGQPVEIQGIRLLFKKQGDETQLGDSADSIDGIVSTRRPNGSNWLPLTGEASPIGEWELALPTDDQTKDFFRDEEIEDILFVISYTGHTPEWPA